MNNQKRGVMYCLRCDKYLRRPSKVGLCRQCYSEVWKKLNYKTKSHKCNTCNKYKKIKEIRKNHIDYKEFVKMKNKKQNDYITCGGKQSLNSSGVYG